MNKYKNLLSNTLIFAVGTFSSKVLVFLLMPIYTSILSTEQYGVVDLIIQVSNLLIPLTSIGITNATIRYGLDSKYKKSDVFTISIIALFMGIIVFLILVPIISLVESMENYISIIFIYTLISNLRAVFSQFIRTKQYVKLYAFDGILSTITTIFFTILFLITFKMGVQGYIWAIIISDILSVIFLFTITSLFKYIKFKGIQKGLLKEMFLYSIPLVPTTIFWWIINVSDRFILTSMLGASENGIYAIAYKIPTFISLISSIFLDAWQMSAIKEDDDRSKFFSRVFNAYSAIIFISISFLIMFSRIFTSLLVSNSFESSWQYIPTLLIATGFSCFVTFFGSIYMIEKKSVLSLITILIGGIINIVMNILLIPYIKIHGAAIATLISFIGVFLIRLLNTKKLIEVKINLKVFITTLILTLIQSYIMVIQIPFWLAFVLILFILILFLNVFIILNAIRFMIKSRK